MYGEDFHRALFGSIAAGGRTQCGTTGAGIIPDAKELLSLLPAVLAASLQTFSSPILSPPPQVAEMISYLP